MGLMDENVCLAVDIVAAVKLAENDRQMAKLASLEAMALLFGKGAKDDIEWDTEVELD